MKRTVLGICLSVLLFSFAAAANDGSLFSLHESDALAAASNLYRLSHDGASTDFSGFVNGDGAVTYAELAALLAFALPEEDLPCRYPDAAVTDVGSYEPSYAAVRTLTRAGAWESGSCPDKTIIRADAEGVLRRALGIDAPLCPPSSLPKAARVPLYFVDDTADMNPQRCGTFGWEYDPRGLTPGDDPTLMSVLDTSMTDTTRMLRMFDAVDTGTLTLEAILAVENGSDGFTVCLSDGADGDACLKIVTVDGTFHAVTPEGLVPTGMPLKNGMTIRTVTDFDRRRNALFADGVYYGTYPFASDALRADHIVYAGTDEGIVSVTPRKTKLYTGYMLCDVFLSESERDTLGGIWVIHGGSAGVRPVKSNAFDECSAYLAAGEGTAAEAYAPFKSTNEKMYFEMKYYMPDVPDGTTFTLCGDEDVFITVADGAYYADDGTLLRRFNANVWQTVRIEADPTRGEVTYSLNCKRLYTRTYDGTRHDGICVTLPRGEMLFDDVFAAAMFDTAEDYVSAPVKVDSAYEIGVEVCDIWRNGYQHGWDYTSSFDELTPLLGRFDEGSTEAADYEIKWLAEHGVDFKLVCWYGGTPSAPLKTPRNHSGLYAALNAKYTNDMRYALMWENTANTPKNAAEYREYVVPYWEEYYLYDRDRYYAIDGKALITVYRADAFLSMCGGTAAGAKAELDYLRSECVKLGYEGAVILTVGGNVSAEACAFYRQMGFDGIYAYNWGQTGRFAASQKSLLSAQQTNALSGGITSVPTVGVGFCNLYLQGGNHRTELITLPEYRDILSWTKDTLLSSRTGEAWQTELVILSNWNEFGEGHYIQPTEAFGFDYLDTVRSVFCGDAPHTDTAPLLSAKARFNALYPQGLIRVRTHELVAKESVSLDGCPCVTDYDFTSSAARDVWGITFGTTLVKTQGSIRGVSTGGDFAVRTSGTLQIDADVSPYLYVRMKLTADTPAERCQFYFLRADDGEWTESKATSFEVIADGTYHEYAVDLGALAAWRGTVTHLRIDPITRGNCTWEISRIALYGKAKNEYASRLTVNRGAASVSVLHGVRRAGDGLLAAIDPHDEGRFFTRLGLFYRFDGTHFTVYAPHSDAALSPYITFTVGSDTALTAVGDVRLPEECTLYDGVPYIDLATLARVLGLPMMHSSDGGIDISHPRISFDPFSSESVGYTFSTPGYLDGLTLGCLAVDGYADGTVTLHSLSNGRRHDPMLMTPELTLDAASCRRITVRMKYDTAAASINSTIYFASGTDAFDEAHRVTVTTPCGSSGGQFVTLSFDMTSSALWESTISRIRFDPFEAEGTLTLDSILFDLARPTSVCVRAGNVLPDGVSVDARGAALSLADDPENPLGKCFAVTSTALTRSYSYFNVRMAFEPGAAYRVSYRLYPLRRADGASYDKNTIGGNFIYGVDGGSVTNHTFGVIQKGSETGWYTVSTVVSVPENHTPSSADCFQLWADPNENIGVSFLCDDIRVETIS